jgi:multidrug transporter EmrE-like cation transporter
MSTRFDVAGHVYVLITLLLTVYGQLTLKWQVAGVGSLPEAPLAKLLFLLKLLTNPWIFSGMAAAFLASLAWMAAMTRLEMSYAYPFMSLAFVLVTTFSVLFLGESLSLSKVAGTLLVVAGLLVIARA